MGVQYNRVVPLACTWLVLVAAGLLAAGKPAFRTLAVILATLSTALPLLVPGLPFVRLVAAIAAAAGLARTVDLSREHPSRPVGARLLQVLVAVDWRKAQRTRARLDPRGAVRTLLHAVGAVLAVLAVYEARMRSLLLPGSLAAAIAIWATAEAVSTLVPVLVQLTGWTLPALHDRPIESKRLSELWGSRWNLTVTRWLHSNVFVPVARRRGVSAGSLAAFAVSAAFHAYMAYAGGGPVLALWMGSFFLVQAVLMSIERALHVERWSSVAARTWMFAGMLLPSPLFSEPLIAITLPALSPLQPGSSPQATRASMPSAAKLGT